MMYGINTICDTNTMHTSGQWFKISAWTHETQAQLKHAWDSNQQDHSLKRICLECRTSEGEISLLDLCLSDLRSL